MVVSVSSINGSSGTFHTVRSNTTTSGVFSQLGSGGDDMDVELLKNSATAEDIVKLEQR